MLAEGCREARDLEREPHARERRLRGDRHAKSEAAELGQRLAHARDGLELLHEGVSRREGPVVDECGGRPLAGASGEGVQHAVDGLPEKKSMGFFGGEREAEIARDPGLHPAREHLTVDEHAVAIEDQRRQAWLVQRRLSSCSASG